MLAGEETIAGADLMSMQQIFDRLGRIFKAEIGQRGRGKSTRDDLRRAEDLIREANERDRRDDVRPFQAFDTEPKDAPRIKEVISAEQRAYRDACDSLGIAYDASYETVVRVYRGKIAQHHPDRVNPADAASVHAATQRTQELIEAFGIVREYRMRA